MSAFFRSPLRLLALSLGLSLTACGHVPLVSLAKLSNVDFATTDLSALRAGIALPETLEPRWGTVRLTVLAETADGVTIRRSFLLEEEHNPVERAGLEADGAEGAAVHVFRLPEREAEDLESIRSELLARKERSGTGGRLQISIGAEACRTGAPPSGSLPMTTYLKTSETVSFVPLARNVDLRSMADQSGGVASLPPCA